MKQSPLLCALAVSGGLILSGCAKKEEPAKTPPPIPTKISLPDKWSGDQKEARATLQYTNKRCRMQIENLLNRERNYTTGPIDNKEKNIESPYKIDYSRAIRLGASPEIQSNRYSKTVHSAWNGTKLEAYGMGSGNYNYESIKYDYCYILAQESLKNLHFSQEELKDAYWSLNSFRTDYVEDLKGSWYKPLHFNDHSDTVQIGNAVFCATLLLLALGGIFGFIRWEALKRDLGVNSLSDLEKKFKDGAQNREKLEQLQNELTERLREFQKLNATNLKKQRIIKNLENEIQKNIGAFVQLQKEREEALGKIEELKQDNKKLEKDIAEFESSAALNCKISAQVNEIFECSDEMEELITRLKKNRKDILGTEEYGLFISISHKEVEEMIAQINKKMLDVSARHMNESTEVYFAEIGRYMQETTELFREKKYRKSFESAMKWLGSIEYIEQLIIRYSHQQGTGNTAQKASEWAQFLRTYDDDLTRMCVIKDQCLIDLFKIIEVEPVFTWSKGFAQSIKTQYRKMAIKLHPDKNPNDPNANEIFAFLGKALDIFQDERLFNIYILGYQLYF